MRNYARFIPGEEIDAVEQWQFGSIDTAAQLLAAQVKAHEQKADLEVAEAERQQAYQAGYAEGVARGKIEAQADLQRQMKTFLGKQGEEAAANLNGLFESAQRQLQDAEQTMAQGVLALSCELARQVLRRELTVNPEEVMPALTEAIGLLGAEFKTAVVKLHPKDLASLGGRIQSDFSGMGLSLRADPEVLQGGCLVESAGTVVDCTLQKRWQRAVATLGLSSSWEASGEPG